MVGKDNKMKTADGYILKEGEDCYVSIQCASGSHRLSPTPRKAKYMDETAKEGGWDFTMSHPIKVDCDDSEVLQVWKNKPPSEVKK